MAEPRTLPWDWYPGVVPENVELDPSAYMETTFSFQLYRSEAPVGVRIGRGASTYLGTMFDLGPRGQVTLGECALVHGAWFICESEITVGDHALISWNVVLMDTYCLPVDIEARRRELRQVPFRPDRRIISCDPGRPIRIGANVWIGFDTCILPGVTIGDGSIVGARSVVTDDVPPYTAVAGNPARVIRRLDPGEPAHGA